jgi:hypothetical protein
MREEMKRRNEENEKKGLNLRKRKNYEMCKQSGNQRENGRKRG